MIRPIQKDDNVYTEEVEDYGITKFIGEDGSGHRGTILSILDEGKTALVYGLTGEYQNKIVEIKEDNKNEWAKYYKIRGEVKHL